MSKVVFSITDVQAEALLALKEGRGKELIPIKVGDAYIDDAEKGKVLIQQGLARRGLINSESWPFELTALGKAAAHVAALLA